MTQEALKLALETLISCELSNYGRDWVWPVTAHEQAMKNVNEAITAIKKALVLQALHDENERLGLYKEAYAQPEPVADDFFRMIVDRNPKPFPLPQRTWVGLAAEDRLTAKYMQDAPDGIETVIDYIEAKLKELNT